MGSEMCIRDRTSSNSSHYRHRCLKPHVRSEPKFEIYTQKSEAGVWPRRSRERATALTLCTATCISSIDMEYLQALSLPCHVFMLCMVFFSAMPSALAQLESGSALERHMPRATPRPYTSPITNLIYLFLFLWKNDFIFPMKMMRKAQRNLILLVLASLTKQRLRWDFCNMAQALGRRKIAECRSAWSMDFNWPVDILVASGSAQAVWCTNSRYDRPEGSLRGCVRVAKRRRD